MKKPFRALAAAALFALSGAGPGNADVTSPQADLAIQSYLKAYWNAPKKYFYKKDDKTGVLDFWETAHAWETVMDAYTRTGGADYRQLIDSVYDGFNAMHGSDWSRNAYNDDIMWWVLASTHAAFVTGEPRFTTQAKTYFDWIYRTQQDTALGGGIWWMNTQHGGKNSCVVQPAIIAAANLAVLLKDDGYRVKAESLFAWQRRVLVSPAGGQVYDNINASGVVSKGSTTYNQGTYIGAALALGRIADAQKAADWTKADMADAAGILRNEGQGDFGTFKLICVRYVMGLARRSDGTAYLKWMQDNGTEAWSNRRLSDNVTGYDWANPAPATGIECQSAAGGVALMNMLAPVTASIVSDPPRSRAVSVARSIAGVTPLFRYPGRYPGSVPAGVGSAGPGSGSRVGAAEFFRADGRFQPLPACALSSCTNSIP